MTVLHVAFNAPLHEFDTEVQTYGCRQSNPDICGSNGIKGMRAFVSLDFCDITCYFYALE